MAKHTSEGFHRMGRTDFGELGMAGQAIFCLPCKGWNQEYRLYFLRVNPKDQDNDSQQPQGDQRTRRFHELALAANMVNTRINITRKVTMI